jgi:parvulin-like peptidyl-prolyl isomerase
MKNRLVQAGLLAALAVASCAKQEDASWVAKAGDVVVTPAEVQSYAQLESTEGVKGMTPEARRVLVQRLVVRKSLAADAEREGFAKDPALAAAVMNWKFKRYPELYWAETVEKETTIGDEELRQAINPRKRYLLSAMVFSLDAAGQREAQRVHRLLVAGGDFAELAGKHSQGLSAGKKGDMGWVEIPNNMVEEQEAAVVAATPVGAFTAPLQTRVGWSIFAVRKILEAEQVFQEAKAQMLPELLTKRLEDARAQRRKELRARAAIAYPAEAPGAPPGAPSAIVNGYAFPADDNVEAGTGHGKMQRVFKPRQQLDRSIDAFLLVQEGERLGFDSRPDVQMKLSQLRMEVLAQLLLRKRAQSAPLTQQEVEEEYRRYYHPEMYEIQLVMVDKRERAEEAHRRALAGEDFDKLGQEFNGAQLAQTKGRLPVAPTVTYPEAAQAVLPQLADGAVSGVLQFAGGSWGLVKRHAKLTRTPPTLGEVEDRIRKRLELRRSSDGIAAFMREYSGKKKVAFNETLLGQL